MNCSFERLTVPVTVHYDRRLEELISAAHFDFVSPSIRSIGLRSRRPGTRQVALELLMFPRGDAVSDEIVGAMRALGYRPAVIQELLALAAKRPYFKSPASVVALGSKCRRRHGAARVPAFSSHSERLLRLICLRPPEVIWTPRDLFAGVRDDGAQ